MKLSLLVLTLVFSSVIVISQSQQTSLCTVKSYDSRTGIIKCKDGSGFPPENMSQIKSTSLNAGDFIEITYVTKANNSLKFWVSFRHRN